MRTRNTTRQQFERVAGPPAVPRLITDGVEVTDDEVWAWVRIPAGATYLLEDEGLTRSTWDTAGSMAQLLPVGAEYHIKVMWSRWSPEEYRESWDSVHSVRAPGAPDYIELGAHRIAVNSAEGFFRRRVVLLGVRWPSGSNASVATERTRKATRTLRSTPAAFRDAHERLAAVQGAIDSWMVQMGRSPLAAEPAPAGLIAWAYAREMRRVAVDAPDESSLAGPVLVDLMKGEIDPTVSPNYVVVTDLASGQQRYVAVLAPATNGFPVTELEIPGGEWLEILSELPGVEASVRGVNHGQTGSIELLDGARKHTRSQRREAEQHGSEAPSEVVDADETLIERRREVQRRLDVMTRNHPRWIVDGATPEELEDQIAAVRQRYTGIVSLQVVPHVQGLLWQELLPGDRVRVPEFGQDQPMRTLAGSWFHGGSAIGDQTGPYVGANLGSSPGPVQVHIVSRSDADRTRPTTVSFTGMSGGGKSTAVMLAILGALAEGAWTLLVDPKGDLAGVIDAAERILGVPVQIVDVTDEAASGIMDPMRFSATVDEARSLTLDAMLSALSADDRRRGEVLLETAIDSVLSRPGGRSARSSTAVINELLTTPETTPGWETARDLGNTLQLRAKQSHLRAVLGPLAQNARPLHTGRGLVYLSLAGLDLPRHNPDETKWTVAERCAMTTFRVSLNYALQQSRNVRELKKLVALTELHLISSYPEGKAFIEWLSRTGRALQTYLLLDTQAAVDLAGLTGLIEQLVMSFAFRATTTAEQDAQAVLLGRPEPGPRLRQAQASLTTGQCVMRDRYGRVGVMEWDRLTEWLAAALSTDAGEDRPDVAAFGTDDADVDVDELGRDDAGAQSAPAEFSTNGAGQQGGDANGSVDVDRVATWATGTEQR